MIQAVTDAGFKVLAMNDGMQEIKVVTTDDEDETEEEPVAEVVPMKNAAKKAAAKPEEPEEEMGSANGGYTREQLEEMDLDGLKAVAAKLGIELPPRTGWRPTSRRSSATPRTRRSRSPKSTALG